MNRNNQILIIDYGMGNLKSIANMIHYLGYEAHICNDVKQIASASKLILPGVGHFKMAMHNIASQGFLPVLNEAVLEKSTPILGICLGMQLMTTYSQEGECAGLGWIEAETNKFQFGDGTKVPHMGWDYIIPKKESSVLCNLDWNSRFYFVHSYYVKCHNRNHCIATTNYGFEFDSIVGKKHIVGMQFHPEKSHRFGMQLMKNFLERY